ncbi:MAG: hypothetical protein IPO81_26620 [Kouleothrix sp.]|nr:hypothetical protein [Kouleothrix sp.]
MRARFFLLGLLIGLAIAPASGRGTWQLLRNGLATGIDRALRIGITPSSASPKV